MRNNVLNVLFFLVVAMGFYFLWTYAEKNWLPQPPNPAEVAKKKAEAEAKLLAEEEEARAAEQRVRDEKKLAAGAVASVAATSIEPTQPKPKDTPKPPEPPKLAPPRERPTLIRMGDSTFYNQVLLTTQGGGIQQIVLPKFQEADRLGREVKDTPLYLVPGVSRVRGRFTLTEASLMALSATLMPEDVLSRLRALNGKEFKSWPDMER